jgi:hypothetical protein
MYNLVISGGDSFTFGAELKTDDSVNPNSNSWANLVARRIGKQHVNVARNGRSNSYIVRHILHQIDVAVQNNIPVHKIFVQVMWTFTNRNEFALSIDIPEYDSPWLGLTPYSHIDETESDWFKDVKRTAKNWQGVYRNLKNNYNRNKELGIVDFAKQYQKLIQTSTLNDSYNSVKEILLLQIFLKFNGIQYLFTYVNQAVMVGLFEDSKENTYTTSVRNFVDMSNWYSFPGDFQTYIGFDDWAKNGNYEYATSHPLEIAHIDAANLIYNYLLENSYLHDK